MKRGVWQLEDNILVTPDGKRVPLSAIEDWINAARGGQQQLITPTWTGWRIVQQWLVPPGRRAQVGGVPLLAVRHLAMEIETERRRKTYGMMKPPEQRSPVACPAPLLKSRRKALPS